MTTALEYDCFVFLNRLQAVEALRRKLCELENDFEKCKKDIDDHHDCLSDTLLKVLNQFENIKKLRKHLCDWESHAYKSIRTIIKYKELGIKEVPTCINHHCIIEKAQNILKKGKSGLFVNNV